jgi:hypothetical protein
MKSLTKSQLIDELSALRVSHQALETQCHALRAQLEATKHRPITSERIALHDSYRTALEAARREARITGRSVVLAR